MLKADQLAYFQVLRERSANKKASEKIQKADRPDRPKEIYIEEKNVDQIQLSPDGKTITYRLTKTASARSTIVPNYVTESGFTEDIPARTKVGAAQNSSELWVYSITKDTVLAVKTNDIPGIADPTDFSKDYKVKPVKDEKGKDKKSDLRNVTMIGPFWSEDGKNNVVVARAMDGKTVAVVTRCCYSKIKVIDRLRDEAWIVGFGLRRERLWMDQ
ncbi:MAG: hypothetical protein WDN75_01795 [Bacteroidota bacterium]